MGAKGFAELLDVTDKEAAKFLQSFKAMFPAVDAFVKDTADRCRVSGYVEVCFRIATLLQPLQRLIVWIESIFIVFYWFSFYKKNFSRIRILQNFYFILWGFLSYFMDIHFGGGGGGGGWIYFASSVLLIFQCLVRSIRVLCLPAFFGFRYCIVPRCSVTFWTHLKIIPLGHLFRRWIKSINQSRMTTNLTTSVEALRSRFFSVDWLIDWR